MKYVVREDATEVDFEDIMFGIYNTFSSAKAAVEDSLQCWKDGWDETMDVRVDWSEFHEVSYGGQQVEAYEIAKDGERYELITWKIYRMEEPRT